MADPPHAAAWRHEGARTGFEVAFFTARDDGWRIRGSAVAVESGHSWSVGYDIAVDSTWTTQSARISARTAVGFRTTELASDGAGRWSVDGVHAAGLDGCLDVDLEASALTNAFPVRRLRLEIGDDAKAPAAYVRALDLGVDRLEQHYRRAPDDGAGERYDYAAPAFDFECLLEYDRDGLVRTYPGIAERVAEVAPPGGGVP